VAERVRAEEAVVVAAAGDCCHGPRNNDGCMLFVGLGVRDVGVEVVSPYWRLGPLRRNWVDLTCIWPSMWLVFD